MSKLLIALLACLATGLVATKVWLLRQDDLRSTADHAAQIVTADSRSVGAATSSGQGSEKLEQPVVVERPQAASEDPALIEAKKRAVETLRNGVADNHDVMQAWDSDAFLALSQETVKLMLRDASSAVFREAFARIKAGKHVACGQVNSKNGFGAMAGFTHWMVIMETRTAMIRGVSNADGFAALWNKYCVGPEDEVRSRKAPDNFRGIRWNAPPISVDAARLGALKGCASIIEQKDLDPVRPCGHFHMGTGKDEIEMYIQGAGTGSIYGVTISGVVLTWYEQRFSSAVLNFDKPTSADLEKLRTALVKQYGPPTSSNDLLHWIKWSWMAPQVHVQLLTPSNGSATLFIEVDDSSQAAHSTR